MASEVIVEVIIYGATGRVHRCKHDAMTTKSWKCHQGNVGIPAELVAQRRVKEEGYSEAMQATPIFQGGGMYVAIGIWLLGSDLRVCWLWSSIFPIKLFAFIVINLWGKGLMGLYTVLSLMNCLVLLRFSIDLFPVQ